MLALEVRAVRPARQDTRAADAYKGPVCARGPRVQDGYEGLVWARGPGSPDNMAVGEAGTVSGAAVEPGGGSRDSGGPTASMSGTGTQHHVYVPPLPQQQRRQQEGHVHGAAATPIQRQLWLLRLLRAAINP